VTVTITELLALPPVPVQLRVLVPDWVRLLRASLPVVVLLPLQAPAALQVVALLLD
jgi:hypothetical protein